MQLGLSEHLSALVARRFTTAKDAGHLIFSQTHLSTIHASGIPYQLRYCPALAKKPTVGAVNPEKSAAPKTSKPDPFQDPSPDLLIAQIPAGNPTHNLVLNKFPVIHDHFILATTAWKPQTDILEKADLAAAYACVGEWRRGDNYSNNNNDNKRDEKHETRTTTIPTNGTGTGPQRRRLFAFFNSGDDSGASQPHRHLQFLPIEAMMRDGEGEAHSDWQPLIDMVSATTPSSPSSSSSPRSKYRRLGQLPFAHFALPIPTNPSADALFSIYISLYETAVAAVRALEGSNDTAGVVPSTEGPAAIAYNLAMTESTMMICPRRTDIARIPVDAAAAAEISDAGVISLNGTILAGTLMVKAEAEWDELRRNPEILANVLATIGYPQRDLREISFL